MGVNSKVNVCYIREIIVSRVHYSEGQLYLRFYYHSKDLPAGPKSIVSIYMKHLLNASTQGIRLDYRFTFHISYEPIGKV